MIEIKCNLLVNISLGEYQIISSIFYDMKEIISGETHLYDISENCYRHQKNCNTRQRFVGIDIALKMILQCVHNVNLKCYVIK